MTLALKRELDDAMVKLKRKFREALDRSARVVNNRIHKLFSTDGTVYNLEKMQEIAFTSDNDEDGLPLMTLGMFESIAAVNKGKDNRKKIIHFKEEVVEETTEATKE